MPLLPLPPLNDGVHVSAVPVGNRQKLGFTAAANLVRKFHRDFDCMYRVNETKKGHREWERGSTSNLHSAPRDR